MRDINKIIIHHSASDFGNAALIDSWHRARGWKGIGYHYVILNGWLSAIHHDEKFNGKLESGRHFSKRGSHCLGHNRDSIGICLIGEDGKFTLEQYRTLANLLKYLSREFGHPDILMHSNLDKTKPHCPGININHLLVSMAKDTA